jgi:homoserine dehydrogenase
MSKKINIVLFGIGKAGSALINKALKNRKELLIESRIDLRFPVITNSTVAFFEKEGPNYSWEANFIQFAAPFRMEDVVDYIHSNGLENLIAIDATASPELVRQYSGLVKCGFNLLSINESVDAMHPEFEREIAITAMNRGLAYSYLAIPKGNKQAAADELFEAILDIAAAVKEVA